MHRRGHNIIPLPPVTPISPKSFCQSIQLYEEYLTDSAMDVDEYVSLGQQVPSQSPGTCSSRRSDGPPFSFPKNSHSDPRWRACSATHNWIFNAGFSASAY